ncbi:MAG: mechanosensitive ion channel [Sulfurimonas sp.]|uniref:mechanosensitive ion channel domain-containing protein n=1 Tax=Sulfurimonas sp. TaxID=2022749 RepID=UPI00262E7440|nr:mechanosensitive ion channel domain-containing protein [Sulfurimonas sp.]MCW8895070.1 mechanosensitive ion channel [Sulfurimonas sp.]MCW8954359.1 mechanosensitive ion channel [Sulfurimonas sp.]MCW9067134.1 mechanosensitive ion channel [Sulfurimonas sp.]
MKNIVLFILLGSSLLLADNVKNSKLIDKQEQTRIELEQEDLKKEKIAQYVAELKKLEEKIANKDSVWMKSYASYLTSLDVRESLEKITKRINYLKKKRKKSLTENDELNALISREKILTSQIEKLKKKDSSPFSNLLTPPNIDEIPAITNPFDIFTGISLVKTLNESYNDYILKKDELASLISLLRAEGRIYKEIEAIDTDSIYKEEAQSKAKQLERFETALDTISVTADVYQKRLEISKTNINKDVNNQIVKIAKIGVIVAIVFVIFFLLKLVVKKYITDHERFYMANKIITFMNFTLIIIILFFNYIENVSYLVTILGFASAGIAIAMKDWFMSILGWLVIVIGGSIHVGDRIRVDMDGMKYVGDVMDISLLRMTILEDITLTSVLENRRAGRIVFVPNNYVFTRMIANYTHSTLKTVWDGVHITITYDSNHKKAMHLAKEITKKYSKGYTDITRKQLNKLRNQYSLKNTNVEPRIFSFIESNGISIDAWYLTNAYATLTLRSIISTEIVDAFMAEDDITIAYPTQMLHMEESAKKKPPFATNDEVV